MRDTLHDSDNSPCPRWRKDANALRSRTAGDLPSMQETEALIRAVREARNPYRANRLVSLFRKHRLASFALTAVLMLAMVPASHAFVRQLRLLIDPAKTAEGIEQELRGALEEAGVDNATVRVTKEGENGSAVVHAVIRARDDGPLGDGPLATDIGLLAEIPFGDPVPLWSAIEPALEVKEIGFCSGLLSKEEAGKLPQNVQNGEHARGIEFVTRSLSDGEQESMDRLVCGGRLMELFTGCGPGDVDSMQKRIEALLAKHGLPKDALVVPETEIQSLCSNTH